MNTLNNMPNQNDTLNQHITLNQKMTDGALNKKRVISGLHFLSKMSAFSAQKAMTVGALLLLLVAVQVSTQSAGDWFLFGLNVLEVTAPVHTGVNDISNVGIELTNGVGAGLASGLQHLGEIIWTLVKAFIECIFG